jgi:hypothetical protein
MWQTATAEVVRTAASQTEGDVDRTGLGTEGLTTFQVGHIAAIERSQGAGIPPEAKECARGTTPAELQPSAHVLVT